MTADQAAAAIMQRSDALGQLRAELEAQPQAAAMLLSELSGNVNPLVRQWAVWAAPRVLGVEAASILSKLAEDVDFDVRTDAMHALVSIDPTWARSLIPKYLEALNSPDFLQAVEAIWRLVQFRAPAALPRLHQLANHADHPAVRNHARVGALVLEGKEDELIQAVRGHDHGLMSVWLKGLAYLGTKNALDALADCSKNGPDESCQRRARAALMAAERLRPVQLN